MNAHQLTDTTLRDGSRVMRHQFTREQVRDTVRALDHAGVPVLEVTHGDGLAGSSVQYGFSRTNEMELIEEARNAATSSKIAALLLPGIGTQKDLKEAIAALGHPAKSTAWLANKLFEFGVSLEPGDVVISGGITKALPVQAGDEFVFSLASPPDLTVTFS
jgi:hypothetical protein